MDMQWTCHRPQEVTLMTARLHGTSGDLAGSCTHCSASLGLSWHWEGLENPRDLAQLSQVLQAGA
jgi:hypothetical protein